MGVRSFLIRFESELEVKYFYKYKTYLAYQIMSNYECSSEINSLDIFDADKVEEFNKSKLYYESFGDFDINIVGFKFWAGSIWGLVSTYSVGESTFLTYVHHFKNHFTRLWNIPIKEIIYNECPTTFLSNYNDLNEALEIYKKMYSQYWTQILDYNLVILNNPNLFEKYEPIDFNNKKICDLFGVQFKNNQSVVKK